MIHFYFHIKQQTIFPDNAKLIPLHIDWECAWSLIITLSEISILNVVYLRLISENKHSFITSITDKTFRNTTLKIDKNLI